MRQWRREMQDRYDIPDGSEFLPFQLLIGGNQAVPACNFGKDFGLTPIRRMEVIASGLRIIGDIAIDTGDVGVINL